MCTFAQKMQKLKMVKKGEKEIKRTDQKTKRKRSEL